MGACFCKIVSFARGYGFTPWLVIELFFSYVSEVCTKFNQARASPKEVHRFQKKQNVQEKNKTNNISSFHLSTKCTGRCR